MSYNNAMPYPTTSAEIRQALAAVIISYRAARGISQQALGQRSGLSQNTMSEIETCKRAPALMTFLRLAHGLDIAPAELMAAMSSRIEGPSLGRPWNNGA